MSVNVKITVSPNQPNYPMLKINSYGMIVLFTSAREGTVVWEGRPEGIAMKRPVGYHSKAWVPEDFSVYSGKVELENEYD